MLLLSIFATPPGHSHTFRDLVNFKELFDPDKLFATAQAFLTEELPAILITLGIAWVLIRVLTYITDRMIRIAERHAAASARVSQTRTLSSVIRATGIGIIGFIAVLQILSAFHVNLAPLLASAGVAGVAIGLACQTVVKDCLNGVLVLIEDQYNVGDVIKIAGLGGTVESMSLRKTMLRDGDGTLYIVPNSQITTVANQTRDFSVATINVDVDYSANPDEVIKLLNETALGVSTDPTYKDAFLAPPTLLGVDAMKGSIVTYPVQLKTKANQQWAAKRELQRRIRIALVEHHMLPGDPLRVFTSSGSSPIGAHLPGEAAAAHPDPTAAKSTDINPFTGEGL